MSESKTTRCDDLLNKVRDIEHPEWCYLANRIERELTALQQSAPVGWMPIESAPKDGAWFTAWDDRHHCPVFRLRWIGKGFISDYEAWSGSVSHWQPLPAASTKENK